MITLKRGDTFKINAEVLGDGVVIPGGIGSWQISSQLRTASDKLIDTFVCTIVDADLCTFTIEESAAGVTSAWPLGIHEMDIRYSIGGEIVHTETAAVTVLRSQTRPVAP